MSITKVQLDEIYSKLISPECNILIISSPTGSGKSVRIPLHIASKNNKTFVSIPTIFAVRSLYEYQISNSRLTTELKSKIGVAANTSKKEKEYNDNSLLVYATTAHIKNKVLSSISERKAIDFCSVLIIDEAHDPSVDTQLLLNLYNYASMSGMVIPKLIIMSATPVNFNFFSKLKILKYDVKIGKPFNVRIQYLNENPGKDFLDDVIINKVKEYINGNGHILIFLPGVNEILTLSNKIRNLKFPKVMVLDLYSGIRDNVDVHGSYGGFKKIIISTNIAENSVTIEGVSLVIDSLLEKITKSPSIEGSTRLVSDYISKNSAIQRSGRTGRTMNGLCIRLCTEEFFELLPQETESELDRLPLHRPCLSIMAYKLNPKRVLLKKYADKVETSIEYLRSLNLLEEGILLNYRGYLCNKSLFSINNTILTEDSNIKYQMIIILSIIESLNLGLIMKRFTREDTKDSRTFLEYLVNLWNDFYMLFKHYRDELDIKKLRKFCIENGLSIPQFEDTLFKIKKQLRVFGDKKGGLINYEEICNYLYSSKDTVVLDSRDIVIRKGIKVWGTNFRKVIVLNSFQTEDKIVVTVFLPIGKRINKENKIRFGLGNYFSLENIEELRDEDKEYLLSLI